MTDEFEKIARETIHQAQGVECPFRDYVKGLRLIVEILQEELTMSESEGTKHE